MREPSAITEAPIPTMPSPVHCWFALATSADHHCAAGSVRRSDASNAAGDSLGERFRVGMHHVVQADDAQRLLDDLIPVGDAGEQRQCHEREREHRSPALGFHRRAFIAGGARCKIIRSRGSQRIASLQAIGDHCEVLQLGFQGLAFPFDGLSAFSAGVDVPAKLVDLGSELLGASSRGRPAAPAGFRCRPGSDWSRLSARAPAPAEPRVAGAAEPVRTRHPRPGFPAARCRSRDTALAVALPQARFAAPAAAGRSCPRAARADRRRYRLQHGLSDVWQPEDGSSRTTRQAAVIQFPLNMPAYFQSVRPQYWGLASHLNCCSWLL